MLSTREAREESGGRLTTVELKVLVYELAEREEALGRTAKALRRGRRYREARSVEDQRKGLERERKAAERRIRQAETAEEASA